MRSILSLVLFACVGSAFAQEPAKPGKEHELLKKFEGKWAATMKMGGQESKCTADYKMDLGGLWLMSTFEGEFGGAKFSGKGTDGYCPIKKKYVAFWTDSMSATPMLLTGDYDADKKTLTTAGEAPGPDGKLGQAKSVTTWKDDDTFTMSMYMGGEKEPVFTIDYKRVKK